MTTFLLDHLEGCTPLNPCASCEAASFLRSKLSSEDFNILIAKIRASDTASLETSVEVLGLTMRTSLCLEAEGIRTIGDLVKKREVDLLKIPNFGRKSLNEIKEDLAKIGRRLGENA